MAVINLLHSVMVLWRAKAQPRHPSFGAVLFTLRIKTDHPHS